MTYSIGILLWWKSKVFALNAKLDRRAEPVRYAQRAEQHLWDFAEVVAGERKQQKTPRHCGGVLDRNAHTHIQLTLEGVVP
jgi:hypothetical protein